MNRSFSLKFDNVFYRYESDDENKVNDYAVKNVSFEIKSGEMIAVLGHNGCGKSTLAKLTNAILIPTEGKVYVNGMDTCDEEKTYDIRQKVGVVFQNPDNQIVASIVEEDVAFGPENLGIPRDEMIKRVEESLEAVDMLSYRKHETHKLSGGQKQRVAIAGILAMRPDCIVLDEPTAMLDPVGRREVLNTVKKFNKELGITIVYITHFMEEAVEADRIIVMDKAEILFDGTPKEVFSNSKKIREIGLDVPATVSLALEIEKEGFDIPSDSLNVDEFVSGIEKLVN
ncbi:MAG: energy-coupling factor transporter ATPase [Clostridiales bacterium]|nr:energy-coupling factor transporter ATPase [Clostridia bacterium]MCR4564221.1 energy-coupling factor transporter ATPase [Clostridiales bacterium]